MDRIERFNSDTEEFPKQRIKQSTNQVYFYISTSVNKLKILFRIAVLLNSAREMGRYFDDNVAPMTNLNWTESVKIPEFICCDQWNLRLKLELTTSAQGFKIKAGSVSTEELTNNKFLQGNKILISFTICDLFL